MKSKNFKIDTFVFTIQYPDMMPVPENLLLFEIPEMTDAGNADISSQYLYQMELVSELPEVQGTVIAERSDLIVFLQNDQNPELESRLIGVKNSEDFYACYQEKDVDSACIQIKEDHTDNFNLDVYFNSLLALERRLINQDGLILHSAYLNHQKKAILFSAPSGVGKSTQAALWERYREARTVNGDRCLLTKNQDNVWMANGWPVCGSSEICSNVSLPVQAIVMLQQAPENHIRRLSEFEAFRMLFSQMTANGWNQAFVEHVMDLVGTLVSEVPVFCLGCTISEEAVACLEGAISDLNHL